MVSIKDLHLHVYLLNATSKDLYEMSLAVESDAWKVDEIENWLRDKVK